MLPPLHGAAAPHGWLRAVFIFPNMDSAAPSLCACTSVHMGIISAGEIPRRKVGRSGSFESGDLGGRGASRLSESLNLFNSHTQALVPSAPLGSPAHPEPAALCARPGPLAGAGCGESPMGPRNTFFPLCSRGHCGWRSPGPWASPARASLCPPAHWGSRLRSSLPVRMVSEPSISVIPPATGPLRLPGALWPAPGRRAFSECSPQARACVVTGLLATRRTRENQYSRTVGS